MQSFRAGIVGGLLICGVCLSACGGSDKNTAIQPAPGISNSSTENANSAKTNLEELGVLVKIPYEAEDIVWKDNDAQKRVIAVLRFSAADANKIVAEAQAFGAPQNVTIESEVWFPDELTAQSDMSGDNALKGLAYPANAFFQERYNAGRVTRIEGGDYFVLELSAK